MKKGMSIVEFSPAFKRRTIDFCKDELWWHIMECEADEYHGEILAQIELLYKLDETESACDFLDDYADKLDEKIEECLYSDDIKNLKSLKREVIRFAKALVKNEIKTIEVRSITGSRQFSFGTVGGD